ncbi:MAG TPA: hypothetical protein VK566_09030 [Nitrososphaeraceae archaeon]|nr:hypothetical protein [Nitrososphaeraceae archaeon]
MVEGVSEHVAFVEAFFWIADSSGGMLNCDGVARARLVNSGSFPK